MTSSEPQFYLLDFNYEGLPPELENWLSLIPSLDESEGDVRWTEQPGQPAPRSALAFSSAYEPFDALDYAMNDVGWPLLSARAWQLAFDLDTDNTLEVTPATVINGVYQGRNDERFTGEYNPLNFVGETLLQPSLVNTEFGVVQAPVLIGKFDWQQSEYQQLSEGGSPMLVTRYVLKDVGEGLPPLFRIVEKPGYLFITHRLREVWKEHGISGAAYRSPLRANWGGEIDIPLPPKMGLSV